MEGLQHRLQGLAASRTQGRLADTPGNSMALTSQVSCECKFNKITEQSGIDFEDKLIRFLLFIVKIVR